MDERKFEVLRAIVDDFIRTNVPVGSKHLVEHHNLGVSPATVRNDMSALEDEGYIAQPHTSAGRIPTAKGYRLFVDRLSRLKPLSAAERKAIEEFLQGAADLDDVVRRTVRLLSQLTRQAAVVQYPSLTRSSVVHVEVVKLAPQRLLLVVIADTGRVEQRAVDVPVALTDMAVVDLRNLLNARLAGRRLADGPAAVSDLAAGVSPPLRPVVAVIVSVVLEMLVEEPRERVAVGGAAYLADRSRDFPETVAPVLEALEEQAVLLRLLGEAGDPDSVRVSIGEENPVEGLHSASIVAVGYGPGTPVASLGVVGPTRMDYAASIAAVRTVARYVGQLLGQGT